MPATSTAPGQPAAGSGRGLEDVTLPDGTVLRGCRPDLRNVADLWGRGWSLIPLKPRSKVPAIRWQEYQERRCTFEELEAWFTVPGFNVGIVTGRVSGLFVIDADSPEAVSFVRSQITACDLRVTTAKGLHLYCPYVENRPVRNKARIAVGGQVRELDVRGDGGYIVGPGSIHPNGTLYQREGSGWR